MSSRSIIPEGITDGVIKKDAFICDNCQEREIDDAPKKCGFSDWCSFCDESLWQTNPDLTED